MDTPANEAEKAPEQTLKQPAEQLKDILQTIIQLVKIQLAKNKKFTDKRLLLAGSGILFLLIIIPILVLAAANGKTKTADNTTTPTPAERQVTKNQSPTKAPKPEQASQVLVYGAWTSQSSVIRAVSLTTSQTTTIATLPLNVKKVHILSPTTLLYIDQTDTNDHGQRISIYNTTEKQIVTNIPAASGYGIDDYVLSPNKKYLAIWEVQFAQNAQTLQGGESRVYAVNLDHPSVVNLLYDETVTPTIPIHDPRAILNDGTVFTDQFIPNDTKGGTGWAYGMSIVDFDGTNKQDISSMTNGTYGSQPLPSADGNYLLFAGYDGTDGTKVVNGYRQAVLNPNTVELLNTKTLARYKLPNLPDTNTYSDVQWDQQTDNIIMSILSPDATKMGVYSYDPEKLTLQQIPLPTVNNAAYGYVSQLPGNKTIIGTQSTDATNLGNLGTTYAYAYTQLAISETNGTLSYLSLEDPFVQYITILPGNYFTPVLGDQTSNTTTISPQPTISYAILQGNNTQQDTSFLKSTLASLRLQGLSSNACVTLGQARCSALGMQPNSTEYSICQKIEKVIPLTANACY
jgi:hypothetical protein